MQTPAQIYADKKQATFIQDCQNQTRWATKRREDKPAEDEARRVESVWREILKVVAELFFLQREMSQPAKSEDLYAQRACTPSERHAFLQEKIASDEGYLDEQRTAGVFTSAHIDAEIERFAVAQGADLAFAKVTNAANLKAGLDYQKSVRGEQEIAPDVKYSVSTTERCPKCNETILITAAHIVAMIKASAW